MPLFRLSPLGAHAWKEQVQVRSEWDSQDPCWEAHSVGLHELLGSDLQGEQKDTWEPQHLWACAGEADGAGRGGGLVEFPI